MPSTPQPMLRVPPHPQPLWPGLRCLPPMALLALTVAGCAPATPLASPADGPAHGPDDDRAVARSVVLCETTERELRRRLGEPTRDGLLRGARVVSWITGEDPVVRYLAVLLDDCGVVVDLYWDLPTEVPWTPADQCR